MAGLTIPSADRMGRLLGGIRTRNISTSTGIKMLSARIPIHGSALAYLRSKNPNILHQAMQRASRSWDDAKSVQNVTDALRKLGRPETFVLAREMEADLIIREIEVTDGSTRFTLPVLFDRRRNGILPEAPIQIYFRGKEYRLTIAAQKSIVDVAPHPDAQIQLTLAGVGVSPGIRVGRAFHFKKVPRLVGPKTVEAGKVPEELEKLRRAIGVAVVEVNRRAEEIGARISDDLAHADFEMRMQSIEAIIVNEFGATRAEDAHVADGERENDSMKPMRRIQLQGITAEVAVNEYLEYCVRKLSEMGSFAADKAADFRFAGYEILKALHVSFDVTKPPEDMDDVVLVADDIDFCDLADMLASPKRNVVALVNEQGGASSHSAYVAKHFRLPAVMGVAEGRKYLPNGTQVIVNGSKGEVVVRPSADTVREAFAEAADMAVVIETIEREVEGQPAVTIDGVIFPVHVNVNGTKAGVDGDSSEPIGLYRWEGDYLGCTEFPAEDELVSRLESLPRDRAVRLRIMDWGGDKMMGNAALERIWGSVSEGREISQLGGMAVYMTRRHDGERVGLELLRRQLRAALRVSGTRPDLSLMLPNVTGPRTVNWVREMIAEEGVRLRAGGLPFNERMQLGVMIEVPSTITVIKEIARDADYFSVGTNDMAAKWFGVPRDSRFRPDVFHTSFLRLLRDVTLAAKAEGKSISVCGDMASRPLAILFLVGIGMNMMSVPTTEVASTKYTVRLVHEAQCRAFAEQLMREVPRFQPGHSDRGYAMEVARQVFADARLMEHLSWWERVHALDVT